MLRNGRSTSSGTSVPHRRNTHILKNGIHNRLTQAQSSQLETTLRQKLCSSNERLAQSSSSDSLSLVLPFENVSIGLTGESDRQRLSEMRQRYCSSSENHFRSDDRQWLEASVISTAITTEWSNCMKNKFNSEDRGLKGELSAPGRGANAIFRVRWDPLPANNLVHPKIKNFAVKGATCEPLILREGVDVDYVWMSQLCQRNIHEDMVVVLNTTAGSVSLHLDAEPEVVQQVTPVAPPPRERCLQGDMEACREFLRDWRPQSFEPPSSPAGVLPVNPAEAWERQVRCQGNAQGAKSAAADLVKQISALQRGLNTTIQAMDNPCGPF